MLPSKFSKEAFVTGLFTQLGKLAASNGQAENQLSRTFAAAFNASPAVREAVLPLFANAFRYTRVGSAADWVCLTEVRTRSGDGRLDLVLVPHEGADPHGRSAIVLENKLGSPLTEQQLLKYQKAYGRLGVITAAYPDVPAWRLRELKVPAFRWHRVHAALLGARNRKISGHWLVTELRKYLEELGMASRGLSWKNVLAIQRTFGLIGGDVSRAGVTSLALDRLALAFAFVEDVAAAVRDSQPNVKPVRMWGPGYYKEDYEEGEGVCHQFGFSLWPRRSSKSKKWIDYYLAFPQDQKLEPHAWAALFDDSEDNAVDWVEWPRRRLTNRQGELREEEHIAGVVRTLRPWMRHIT